MSRMLVIEWEVSIKTSQSNLKKSNFPISQFSKEKNRVGLHTATGHWLGLRRRSTFVESHFRINFQVFFLKLNSRTIFLARICQIFRASVDASLWAMKFWIQTAFQFSGFTLYFILPMAYGCVAYKGTNPIRWALYWSFLWHITFN